MRKFMLHRGFGNKKIMYVIASIVVASVLGYYGGKVASAQDRPLYAPKGYEIVKKLSQADGKFVLLEGHTDFDIRPQSTTLPRSETDRVQLTVMTDTLKFKKTGPGRYVAIPYSTSSKAGIDLWCNTHRYVTEKVDSIDFGSGEENGFGILIDLGSVSVGEEVDVVVKGYFWNGFKRAVGETAATYTDPSVEGLRSLKLSLQLPDARALKRFTLKKRKFSPGAPSESNVDVAQAQVSKDRRKLLWEIKAPQPETVYKVVFDW